MTECVADTEKRWACITKTPGETFPVILSAFGMCAQFWEANEQWDPDEYCWPTKANGFVAQCTSLISGRSAIKEPRWTDPADGATYPDGSVTWTLRVPTLLTGIQPISNPVATLPTGIDCSVIVVENTKLAIDYFGGTAGESYQVLFTFDIAGRPRQGSQIVHVAER